MLTADLVTVRRRKGQIVVPDLSEGQRQHLRQIAFGLIEICEAYVGQSRGQLLAAWDALTRSSQPVKQVKALRKLLLDRCTFEDPSQVEPRLVRRALFHTAARLREAVADGQVFQPSDALELASKELSMDVDAIGVALYSDLKENHRLLSVDSLSAEGLVAVFEQAQRQAVLLRATRVKVTLRSCSPSEYRAFFQRLKFRRLLYMIHPLDGGGFEVDIDGPFSLFQAVTKYGLQLALLLPALEDCTDWQLDAEIAWGKARERCGFQLCGKRSRAADSRASPWIPEDIERLRIQMSDGAPGWKTEVSDELLNLPGIGVCVPDLSFTHQESGLRVHLEVMGYWSREAVWKRVELVEAGLQDHVIFAVSRRLRVSEEVLEEGLPGQLYVYKGVMSPSAISKRLDACIAQREK